MSSSSSIDEEMSSEGSDHEEEVLKFQFTWTFEVSELGSCAFDEGLYSPVFKTVHNNMGFRWRLCITPNGGRCFDWNDMLKEYSDHLGFFTEYVGNKELKAVLSATCDHFVEVGEQVKKRSPHDCEAFGRRYFALGVPEFLPKSVDEMRAAELISGEDILKLGIILKISESEFSSEEILDEEEMKIVTHLKLDFCHLFEDIITTQNPETEAGSTNQQRDKKLLDFKVLTSDQKIIWCHRVILAKKNTFFHRLITSEMKEGESSQMEVKYGSVSMKELLHFIYTDRISKKFPDSDLRDLLDGAEMYELLGLKLICERKMIEQIGVDNAAEYVELADRYGLKILREVSMNFASENASGIRKTEKGKELRADLLDAILEVVEERSRVVKVPSWMKVEAD